MPLLINGAKNAKVGSKISGTTRLAKNLSTLVDITKNADVDGHDIGDGDDYNKTGQKTIFSLENKCIYRESYFPTLQKNEFFLIILAIIEIFN